ncbi:alpha/beta hydrolase [Bacillus pseudomycoides]|uniref:alpha/beta hydrolase n=1 Tax=Bacillus pseudomycoides TaxID=64104 RepID=UPI000BED57F5|nr:alpha/beta hydrolase [Bacillus pseudomycoides]MED4653728.1 alpha/beta hydrolase [Bacillus pseudomycoides]PEE06034.1 lipase [Bacillus pseudomycoides]PEM74698.1 lipase [Bacillus pseudomycoides]PHC80351.1 lipase [Bacillus pseudomycoides]
MINLNDLEPGIRTLVTQFIEAGRPSARQQSFHERRQGYLNTIDLAGEAVPVWNIVDQTIDGLPLRIYKSSNQLNLPILIYYHGGCFVSGDFETHDRQMRRLANLSKSLVIAVGYRLAPEHVYPAAHDDAVKATYIVRQYASAWGGNPDNITLAGDSAGGHLTLVTCLRLKVEGKWLPQRQILIYPMLDANGSSNSYKKYGDDYVITRDMLLSGFEAYLSNLPPNHPEASPLYREDFTDLPETHILTAEFDPLVDEGEMLYRRLLEAGVKVQCRRYLGVNHGFFQLAGISPAGKKAIEDVASIVR